MVFSNIKPVELHLWLQRVQLFIHVTTCML